MDDTTTNSTKSNFESAVYEEFMGTENLVIAEIITDNDKEFKAGDVMRFAPVAEISKSTKVETETKYYDNVPWKIITVEGEDTIKLAVPAFPADVESFIKGKKIDEETGAVLDDGIGRTKYFALGYMVGLSDGTSRLVWRTKGSFQFGDEKSKTRTNKPESQGIELTYVGISTIHKFKYSDADERPCKAVFVDEKTGKIDREKFFASVITPETISTAKKTETETPTEP